MKWILILTFYIDGGYDGGPAVTAVNGFQDQQACVAAGNAWMKRIRQRNEYTDWLDAYCVPDRSP